MYSAMPPSSVGSVTRRRSRMVLIPRYCRAEITFWGLAIIRRLGITKMSIDAKGLDKGRNSFPGSAAKPRSHAVPPLLPVHCQVQGPVPKTAELCLRCKAPRGGATLEVAPLAGPHKPFTGGGPGGDFRR